MLIEIIAYKTDVNEPTRREGFSANKRNWFIPQGLNQRDFLRDFAFVVLE